MQSIYKILNFKYTILKQFGSKKINKKFFMTFISVISIDNLPTYMMTQLSNIDIYYKKTNSPVYKIFSMKPIRIAISF